MAEIRRKNIGTYWFCFSKFFRPWLKELTEKYKERGEFPVYAAWLLPSYYQDPNDVEVAAVVAMLIKDNDKVLENVEEFRQLIGDRPYDWFVNRGFVSLSIGREQLQKTGGVKNAKIAQYLNSFYCQWNKRQDAVEDIFSETFSEATRGSKRALLNIVLASSDGMGRGIWSVDKRRMKCPQTDSASQLMRTYWPDYCRYGSWDDAVSLFGFESDSDFFYAALAYEELQRERPNECKRLAYVYQKRYKNQTFLKAKYWLADKCDGILLELD